MIFGDHSMMGGEMIVLSISMHTWRVFWGDREVGNIIKHFYDIDVLFFTNLQ